MFKNPYYWATISVTPNTAHITAFPFPSHILHFLAKVTMISANKSYNNFWLFFLPYILWYQKALLQNIQKEGRRSNKTYQIIPEQCFLWHFT